MYNCLASRLHVSISNVRFYGTYLFTFPGLRNGFHILKPCKKTGTLRNVTSRKVQTQAIASESKQFNLNINTNILNNVLLFKSERQRFYPLLNISGIINTFGWTVLSYSLYTGYRDKLWDKNLTWKQVFYEHPIRIICSIMSLVFGWSSYVVILLVLGRSIKYVILNKGGETATFVTFYPRKKYATFTLPLSDISCHHPRSDDGGTVTLKITGKSLYYFISSSEGKYVNPELFDATVGMARNK